MVSGDWGNFIVIVGGASAALTGLIFVAVSVNIVHIAPRPLLRDSAAQALVLLLCPLVIAILVAIPGQDSALLGVELLVSALLIGITLALLRAWHTHDASADERRAARLYQVSVPNLVTTLPLLASGVSLLLGRGGGCIGPFRQSSPHSSGGVATAWLFMIRLFREERREQ